MIPIPLTSLLWFGHKKRMDRNSEIIRAFGLDPNCWFGHQITTLTTSHTCLVNYMTLYQIAGHICQMIMQCFIPRIAFWFGMGARYSLSEAIRATKLSIHRLAVLTPIHPRQDKTFTFCENNNLIIQSPLFTM